jgi:membrane protease YdiL (CAAX protease family)
MLCKSPDPRNNDAMSRIWLDAFVTSPAARKRWHRYALETRRPLTCLVFLLPLVALFEYGAARLAASGRAERALFAQNTIQDLLSWFGFVGFWGPPAVLIVALLVWHGLRRERWRLRWSALPWMAIEGVALAVPLLVLGFLFEPQVADGGQPLVARLLRGLGGALYEELLFRFLLLVALAWFGAEVLRLPAPGNTWFAVALSAVAFSLAHLQPVGQELFQWNGFGFRLAAGVYLAVVFLGRGLGVAAVAHVAYNMLQVLWRGV